MNNRKNPPGPSGRRDCQAGEQHLIDIILHEPEIPMNTGNIARTCACTGARLHLIRPLGFDVSDRAVKRAGLDYWKYVDITLYDDLDDFFARNGDANLWLATTKAPRCYADADLTGDVKLMFGKETAGLPEELRERYRDRCLRIPMIGPVRSLNLANSVAIVCYEALRQQGFPNLKSTGSMMEEEI
jgi:tRNA (cytidine/uridine-2'-O-)-methyltransferase